MTPFKFRMFLLIKIPLCFIAGIKLLNLSDDKVEIGIKHSWWNQNPFRSIYFGALGMAAELSTGLLLINSIQKKKANVSMLVTGLQSTFTKKAVGKIKFICIDESNIVSILDSTIATGEGKVINLTAVGKDEAGDNVATFVFEWSVKKRSK